MPRKHEGKYSISTLEGRLEGWIRIGGVGQGGRRIKDLIGFRITLETPWGGCMGTGREDAEKGHC